MDLKEYERAKFELAEVLRAAEILLRKDQPNVIAPFGDLFARLAEDRFNLAVVGRFNRGKTSLINAMLATDKLPTGIVPLTSVITTVSYGSSEAVTIEYRTHRFPSTIGLGDLREYITQEGNPGNQRAVSVARVQFPTEILRQGFHFVDTPGLGSSIVENTRTTEAFLPETDALILVTSFDSPFSAEELAALERTAGRRAFIVVNKCDTVSTDDQRTVLRHIEGRLREVKNGAQAQIFAVSARMALDAHKTGNDAQWRESGVPVLLERLTRFLVDEKQTEFLRGMCERIGELLSDLPDSWNETARVGALMQRLRIPSSFKIASIAHSEAPAQAAKPFFHCEICHRIDREVYDYLRKFQYHVAVRQEVRDSLSEAGGFCDFHTWQYQAIASPHGTCLGFPAVLDRLADQLRGAVSGSSDKPLTDVLRDLRPSSKSCPLCRFQREVERQAISDLAGRVAKDGEHKTPASVCLRHLQLLCAAIDDRDLVKRLVATEAETLDRVAGDMRRYAVKFDGTRRLLMTKEEEAADLRGLILLAGHRNVTGGLKSQ